MERLLAVGVVALVLGACGGGGTEAAPPPPPPEVSAVVPASGGVDGGRVVTVSGPGVGAGDPDAVAVAFGDDLATDLVVLDEDTLTCRTPPHAAGPCDVTVTTDRGHGTLAAAFTFHPAPVLAGVSPPRGPVGGGTALTVTGAGFLANDAGSPAITFGGLAATDVLVVDDTTLTCVAPAQPGLGDFDVIFGNDNGAALLLPGFTCVPAPTLSGVLAADGPAGGFTRVTVTGSGFDAGALEVRFGTSPATEVAVVDGTTLTCLTPEGPEGQADVSVSTYGGTTVLPAAWTWTTFTPDDPLFASQWHLENTAQDTGSTAGEDAHAKGAWDLGYTGKGVTIGVVDDGLELLHEDLAANVASGSWDYGGDDADPTRNLHGTSVAGVSSAVGANGLGGLGIAPGSKVVGFAVLTSGATDGDIADALARDAETIHAYNNSWGAPPTSGSTVLGYSDTPTSFVAALDHGLDVGRGGLGSVYVKAAGNWAPALALFDGTNGLRGMNVIAAVNADGKASSYSQAGPCVLVCAPSNDGGHPGITTTDRTGASGYSSTNYTSTFGGTSSATPLVSGVVALILEVRPTLRWWEVPLVLADSARKNDPTDAGWSQNGAGRWVNPKYGFGVVDADAAMDVARAWVPRNALVASTHSVSVSTTVPKGDTTGVTSTITVPATTGIATVHRATVRVFIDHTAASDLNVVLTGPAGTQSVLASTLRTGSVVSNSMSGMALVSWRHLGETPEGTWSLTVSDGGNVFSSTWSSWTLVLEGEGTVPPSALVAAKIAAPPRPRIPAAPTSADAAWWNGERWCEARRDASLLGAWSDGRLDRSPDVLGRERTVRGFAIWRLRGGVDARSVPGREAGGRGEVYRDGRAGDGRLRVLTGRLLVRLEPGIDPATVSALEARYGLEPVGPSTLGDDWRRYRVTASGLSSLDVARSLLATPGVLVADVDWWTERVPN